MTKEEYNQIPVHYCKNCLSLAIIKSDDNSHVFCKDCGGTEMSVTSIDTWEFLFEQEFGKLFVNYGRK
jgi:hypothetical protein